MREDEGEVDDAEDFQELELRRNSTTSIEASGINKSSRERSASDWRDRRQCDSSRFAVVMRFVAISLCRLGKYPAFEISHSTVSTFLLLTRFHEKPLSGLVAPQRTTPIVTAGKRSPFDTSCGEERRFHCNRRALFDSLLPTDDSIIVEFKEHEHGVSHEYSIMFCLRSWLPLLFIPTNASPIFIFLFFVCTYFLNRPCVYCSFLLLILFASSCHWSDHCFFDFSSNWFEPRQPSSSIASELLNASASSNPAMDQLAMFTGAFNNTAVALVGAGLEEAKRQLAMRTEWTGIGVEWLRSLLGRREWRLPCLDVYVRL